jgi:tetratricopeptide (TPR) repeat protein
MMLNNGESGKVVLSLFGEPLRPPLLSDEVRGLAEGNLAMARGNYEADPNLENTIWFGRRLAYLFLFEEALAVYMDGIGRFPQAHQLYRHRGHRYISTRQFDRAVADLERAAELVANQPVTVEPDGIPNKLNRSLSNSHFNIWYHLGLVYYLLGRWETAVAAYQTCLSYCDNPDLLTATVDWLYMTYRRLGDEAAKEIFSRVLQSQNWSAFGYIAAEVDMFNFIRS